MSEIRNCTDSGTTPPADPAWMTCAGNGTADADTNLTTSYEYDARGHRVAVIAPDPADDGTTTATVTTRYAFDASNRLCGVLQNATIGLAAPDPCATAPGTAGTPSENVWTRYTYDAAGNMATMVDGNGNTTTYGYDASGRMTSLTDGLGNATSWIYDALGRRTSQSARGTGSHPTLISWTYDAAGRMKDRLAGGVTTTYGYDVLGNRLTAQTGSGPIITATYDRLNRPLTVTVSGDNAATTTYSYSLDSPSWTDPSGQYSATLDAFDRQLALTDPVNGSTAWSFAYRADGQPASISAPNGNTTTLTYDDAAMLEAKQTTSGSTNRVSYTWSRNRAGQVIAESYTPTSDTPVPALYEYDGIGRLTAFTRDGATTFYGWQAVPNRASVQVASDPAEELDYDAANRITTTGFGHDLEGQMTARPGQVLDWDDLGRLVEVTDGSSTLATYTYDALDRLLVVDRGPSDVVRFRYVGLTTQLAQVVDQDDSDTVIRSFANDWAGARLFDWAGTDERYYGTNGHHDVSWTADDSGAVTATLRYDPWGNLTSSTGSSLPDHRFQGSWLDSTTDLYWVVARWYAPSLGRFVSEDSLLGHPEDPPSRHLYAYGVGEPVGRWDPDGRFWYTWRKGDTLWNVAARFYGHGWRLGDIVAGNVGPPVTPNTTRALTAGKCVWVPFVDKPHQCQLIRGDSTLVGDRLYRVYDDILARMTDEMIRNSQPNAGGVGHWTNISGIPEFDIASMFNVNVLALFYVNVQPGGVWDHKWQLQKQFFHQQKKPFWTAVRGDPAPESMRHDVWSNIHYGYVGRSRGIARWLLQDAAWAAGKFQFNPEDEHSVRIGMDLWDRYGMAISRSRLHAAVRSGLGEYRGMLPGRRAIRPQLVVVGGN